MTARKPDEIALAEYKQIKTEQAARISTRDNLLYATAIAIGAVLASSHSTARYLLISPVTFVLGWNYLRNDDMITLIGRYFQDHPRLPGLRWETGHRPPGSRHRLQKLIQLGADLTAFCGSALVALIGFWAAPSPQPPVLYVASAFEALATGLLASQFIWYGLPVNQKPQSEQEK